MKTAVYYKVFGALIVLTILTVIAAEMDLGMTVAILIAAAKASLVGVFFMHLKSEGRFTYLITLLPVAFFLVLVLLMLPDFFAPSP